MKRTPKHIVTALIALTLITFRPAPALPCSCMMPDLTRELDEADAVFAGRVVAIETSDPSDLSAMAHSVELEVLDVFVGPALPSRVCVSTPASSAACGYPFHTEQAYLVIAYETADGLAVSLCSSTQPVRDAEHARDIVEAARIGPIFPTLPLEEPAPEPRPAGHEATRVTPTESDSGAGPVSEAAAQAPPPIGATSAGSGVMQLANTSNLGDLLWQARGVHPVRRSRASTGVTLRGLGGRRTLTVWDGIPINDALLGQDIDSFQSFVDLRGLAEVEVDLGPGSARYGSDAMGGVVHLQSRRPTVGEWGGRGQLLARFATNELAFDHSPRLELGLGPVALFLGGNMTFRNDVRPGPPLNTGYDTDFTQFGGHLRVIGHTSVGRFETVGHFQRQIPQRVEESEPPFDEEFDQRWRDFTWVGWESDSSADVLGRVQLAYFRQGTRWIEADDQTPRQQTHHIVLTGGIEVPVSNRVAFGVDLDLDTQILDVDGLPRGAVMDERADGSRLLTPSAASHLTIIPNDDTSLELGARASWRVVDVPASASAEAVDLSDVGVSGSLTLIRQITEILVASLRASTGFSHPNLADVALEHVTDEGLIVPNTSLSSEQIIDVEGALRLLLDPFRFEVRGYYGVLFDLIERKPTGAFSADVFDDFGAPVPILRPENLGNARIYGVEGLMATRLGDLRFVTGVSWNRADDQDSGRPLPNVTPVHGHIALLYGAGAWGAGAYTRFAAAEGETETDGFAIFGPNGYVRFARWGHLIVTVDNVASQGYRTHGSTIPEPGLDAIFALHFSFP